MPGFVDVTGWSSEEVRRLGHADDYDEETNRKSFSRNPYAYRKPKYTKPTPLGLKADDVWSAAVQAQSINGSYVKAIAPGIHAHKTNRQIMAELLADTTQITQESRDKAEDVRKYFKAFTFKILQGKNLNEFNNTAMTIANRDVIDTNYDIAVIASLPASYEKGSKRDAVDRRINFASGGFLGTVGDKVTVKIEVVKKLYSQNYTTWYITGLTDDDKVLFFSYKHQIEIGDCVTIEGKVKSHRDTSTQLSHVKVVK